MLIIGLTGGIGSGKSTAANYFAKLGTPVIDADRIARELMQPGTDTYHSVIKHFGESILTAENTINRQQLRQLIFNDSQHKAWLEGLLHPLIYNAIAQQLRNITAPYCIVVIPLLLEKNWQDLVQRILVIDASTTLQRQRVQSRDNMDEHLLEQILKNQHSSDERNQAADDVIKNDYDLEHLQQQVTALHQRYLTLAAQVNK